MEGLEDGAAAAAATEGGDGCCGCGCCKCPEEGFSPMLLDRASSANDLPFRAPVVADVDADRKASDRELLVPLLEFAAAEDTADDTAAAANKICSSSLSSSRIANLFAVDVPPPPVLPVEFERSVFTCGGGENPLARHAGRKELLMVNI
jgi:hypothetical protein